MSGVATSIKNVFKHPEDIAAATTKSDKGATEGSSSSTSDNKNVEPVDASKLSGQHQLNHEDLSQAVPSTGYVGDGTSGRFPGEPNTNSSSHPTSQDTTTTANDLGKSSTDQANSGSTGREGVPGTTSGGDPSMGGKFTRAQGST